MKRIYTLSIFLILFLAGCVGGPAGDPKVGEELFTSKECTTCHTIDGTTGPGPTLKGVYGQEVTLDTGMTLTADDAYLKESILDSDAKIVKGFPAGLMPAVILPGSITDEEADDLVAYIRTLS
ncbi:MAG: c-type cytochrome [Candidatus Hydrothermarchaeaceae archaeon]